MTRLHDHIHICVFQADDARYDVNEACFNSSQQIDTPGERCCFFCQHPHLKCWCRIFANGDFLEKEHMKYKRNLHTHTLIDT